MKGLKDYDFLICEDGIYFGKAQDDGSISEDARKVSEAEILAMFEDYLKRYCARNVTNVLEVERDGKTLIEAKLFIR